MEDHKSSQGTRALQRGIDIMNCFSKETLELSLTEISRRTTLAKSTVTRLLATLESNNFLERNAITSKYRLGRQVYLLGNIASQTFDVKRLSEEKMKKLREEVKETVNLYILDGIDRVCIQQFESLYSVKHMVQIGQKLPLTMGASGKVLLAYQTDDFIEERIIEELPIKGKEVLLRELKTIYKTYYAVSIDEREVGTSAVASPIFDIDGEIVAALSISGPSNRFQPDQIDGIENTIKKAAYQISKSLGYMNNDI